MAKLELDPDAGFAEVAFAAGKVARVDVYEAIDTLAAVRLAYLKEMEDAGTQAAASETEVYYRAASRYFADKRFGDLSAVDVAAVSRENWGKFWEYVAGEVMGAKKGEPGSSTPA